MNKDRFKFRVWSAEEKSYDHKFPFNTLGIFYIAETGRLFSDFGNSVAPELHEDRFVVEQCTGLKDKNGNLIYEGDIVLAKHSYKSRPGKFIVKWGQAVGYIVTAGFWLFDFSPITLETAKRGDDFPESSEIEIIGNIHKQKENQ